MRVGSIILASGLVVRGVLWQTSKSDEDKLDIFEAVSSNLYTKESWFVSLADEKGDTLLYTASNSKLEKQQKYYLQTIIESIVFFNTDVNWTDKAQSQNGLHK